VRVICHACGEANELVSKPGRRDDCARCGQELRCCLQCRLFDEATDCREPQADVPREKDRANFCEFFEPGEVAPRGPSQEEKAKAAFDALFKKK
jgi:hypothetical protein